MPRYYPVFLNLEGKRAVIICGGREAERKIPPLLACGAQVTLISPTLTPQLEDLARDGAVTVCRRTYTPGDMKGAYLAIVGTEDVGINHEAASEARREGVLVNTVDDIPYCDFAAPAVVQQGDLTVAISTNGKSPAMARRMREELESYLTPDYADLLNVMAKVRITLLRQRIRPRPDRWQEHIDAELRDLIKQGDLQMAQDYLLARLVESAGLDGTLTQAEQPGAPAS